jgi:hypothetical protein
MFSGELGKTCPTLLVLMLAPMVTVNAKCIFLHCIILFFILQMKLPLKSCVLIKDLLQSFLYICMVVPPFTIVCSQNE